MPTSAGQQAVEHDLDADREACSRQCRSCTQSVHDPCMSGDRCRIGAHCPPLLGNRLSSMALTPPVRLLAPLLMLPLMLSPALLLPLSVPFPAAAAPDLCSMACSNRHLQ